MRLSIINFAGIARTLVAVGTLSDASIDATTRPATPRSGSIVAALGVIKTGAGFTGACAGVGVETCATGSAATGAATTGAGTTGATGAGAETFCAAFGTGGVPPLGAEVFGADVADVIGADVAPGLYVLKNSIQEGSTEVGSAW